MAFIYNAWYVAAWLETITEEPKHITMLNEQVMILKNADGEISALSGVCPHRFASLSGGKVIDGAIECPYHGLRFNTQGQCIRNPHGDGVIAPNAKLHKYPSIEKHHALWVWMGDPSKADPDLVPDFSAYDGDRLASSRDYLHVKANYELMNDNLLDLSHAAYIHPFLSNEDFASKSRRKIEQSGNKVSAYTWNDDEILTPIFKLSWHHSERADIRVHMHWTAPSSHFLDLGLTLPGRPIEEGHSLPSSHLLTPETENSTHYFWTVGRDYQKDVPEVGTALHNGTKAAFENEDHPMITQVHQNMRGRDFWDLNPVILETDGGAIRARRIIQKMVRMEQDVAAE